MPRRGRAPSRTWMPDPIYNSVLVSRITNKVMSDGEKSTARRLVYSAMDIILSLIHILQPRQVQP